MSATRALRALTRAPMPTASSSRLAHTSIQAGRAAQSEVPIVDFQPYEHLEPKHGHHVMTLLVRSYGHIDLDFYLEFVQRAARNLQIPTTKTARLPTTRDLHTVLKAPFVHKKAQENLMRLTHRRVIKVYDTSPEVLDLWLRYIKRHSLPGIGAKAYVYEMVKYGFASGEVTKLEKTFGETSNVQRLADRYIAALGGDEFDVEVVKAVEGEQAESAQAAPASDDGASEGVKEAEAQVAGAEAVVDAPATASEEAVKAEKSSKKAQELQQETAAKADAEAVKEAEAQFAGEEAVVDAPKTASEQAVKAETSSKKPAELQKETAKAAKAEAKKSPKAETSKAPKAEASKAPKA